MKSYNEMAQSVLSRINEYEAAEKRKRKIFCTYTEQHCCSTAENVDRIFGEQSSGRRKCKDSGSFKTIYGWK